MTEYTYDLQKLFIEMMLHNAQSFIRVQNIFNKDNFDSKLQPVAEFIETHSKKYNTSYNIKDSSRIRRMENAACSRAVRKVRSGAGALQPVRAPLCDCGWSTGCVQRP